jgi:hypothetical protein
MPAQSPTLSPTLSAITPGFRGSSSGIPASTLPTKSVPTSAAFVKIPPPKRAKMEIKLAPKPSPISGFMSFVRKFNYEGLVTLEVFPMSQYFHLGLPSKEKFAEAREIVKESFEVLKRSN